MSKGTRQFLSGERNIRKREFAIARTISRNDETSSHVQREQGWISTRIFILFPGSCYRRDVCTLGERLAAVATSGTEEVGYLVGKLARLCIRSTRIFYVAMRISIPRHLASRARSYLGMRDRRVVPSWNLDSAPLLRTVTLVTNVTRGCRPNRCKELDSRATRFRANPAQSKFQWIRKSNFHCFCSPSKLLSFRRD